MALTRPLRTRTPGLQMEPVQEVTVEAQMLSMLGEIGKKVDEVKTGVDGAKGQIRDLQTSFLGTGEPGRELPHGRIPMLENTADDHEKRIDRLERFQIRWGAYAVASGVMVGVAQFFLELIFGHR